MPKARGTWISVDGVDAVGKSTVAPQLARLLDARSSNEFSASLVGNALRQSVAVTPNYILRSMTGQSLAFIGDFFEVYETQIQPTLDEGGIVVSDRGWLSKYAFQFVTLADGLGPDKARAVLENTLGLIPKPLLTIHLDAPIEILRQRIQDRDGACDASRAEFNRRTQEASHNAIHSLFSGADYVQVDATGPVEKVVTIAATACRSALDAWAKRSDPLQTPGHGPPN